MHGGSLKSTPAEPTPERGAMDLVSGTLLARQDLSPQLLKGCPQGLVFVNPAAAAAGGGLESLPPEKKSRSSIEMSCAGGNGRCSADTRAWLPSKACATWKRACARRPEEARRALCVV